MYTLLKGGGKIIYEWDGSTYIYVWHGKRERDERWKNSNEKFFAHRRDLGSW